MGREPRSHLRCRSHTNGSVFRRAGSDTLLAQTCTTASSRKPATQQPDLRGFGRTGFAVRVAVTESMDGITGPERPSSEHADPSRKNQSLAARSIPVRDDHQAGAIDGWITQEDVVGRDLSRL